MVGLGASSCESLACAARSRGDVEIEVNARHVVGCREDMTEKTGTGHSRHPLHLRWPCNRGSPSLLMSASAGKNT
jgi:hypothetical protein